MKRRDFFKNGGLLTLGGFIPGMNADAWINHKDEFRNKKANNIIFMVSDGMSTGTLNMADILLKNKMGTGSNWLNLYRAGKINRALMDTASADSLVTDSAAGSSSWGGGKRVPNGSLNVAANGEKHLPILQKFKKAGKKVGCVTTVPITHATPAGFCVMQKNRGDQDSIALQYVELDFDVMMGGGREHFDPKIREDGKDVFRLFESKDYTVLRNRQELQAFKGGQKILGVFAENGLPYALDRENDSTLTSETPSLQEMTRLAIEQLSEDNDKGFVLQIEGGKVDWAAHANDPGALLYDQIAFDEAVKVAIDFAERDQQTLVVITTDHGNANPGLIKSSKVNENFSHLEHFTHTNEWILRQLNELSDSNRIREVIERANGGNTISRDQSIELAGYYNGQNAGLYNTGNLPYRALSELQREYTSIGWISMDHSGDYVELTAFGPGSEKLNAFVKNYELHQWLLDSAEVDH